MNDARSSNSRLRMRSVLLQLSWSVLLAACVAHTQPADFPGPAYADELLHSVACDAHILERWRSITAQKLAGRVKVPDVTFLDGRKEPGDDIPGAFVAVRMRGSEEIHT